MFGISAANSLFLWLLPLAGLPILFHLFLRIRKQVRPFSSLMFFLQAVPRLSARKKIREWLALILRVLVIAFLFLALSRPVWLGRGGGGPASRVLIVDNSGSMSGKAADGRPKLTHALDAAAGLIADMTKSDSLGLVLLADDPVAALPDGLVADKNVLRSSLDRIRETHASGTPGKALSQAFSLLAAASTARREVHILTDAQETEWGKLPGDHRAPPAVTSVTVHRIGSRPHESANVSVHEIELPRRVLVAGRRYMANVTLHNRSKVDARVRLNSSDQNGSKDSQQVDVPAHGARTATLRVETHAAGPGWLCAGIENDAFQPDNYSCVAFTCRPRRRVVFGGPCRGFGCVPLAVSPSGDGGLSGLIPVSKRAGVTWAEELKDDPAMVVLRWSALLSMKDDQAPLRFHLEQGGNLLVLPDAGFGAGVEGIPPWLPIRLGKPVASEKGFPATVLNKQAALWDDLRDESGEVMLRQIRIFKCFPLQRLAGGLPLMALQDGTVILAQHSVGNGMVFVSGVDFDSKASTLPLKGGFVAMIHGMALSGRNQSGNVTVAVAGSGLPVRELSSSNENVRIRAVAGAVMEWQGPIRSAPALARAGIYSAETSMGTSHVAVRSSPDEGREAFVHSGTIPALADIPHGVEEYKDHESFVRLVRKAGPGIDLYLAFLLMAFLATLAEGLIINRGAVKYAGRAMTGRWLGVGGAGAAASVRNSWLDRLRHWPHRILKAGFSVLQSGGS